MGLSGRTSSATRLLCSIWLYDNGAARKWSKATRIQGVLRVAINRVARNFDDRYSGGRSHVLWPAIITYE
jgi:hypothetical protein